MFALFAIFLCLQAITGFKTNNADLVEHGRPSLDFSAYLSSGHFIEATFENWESEYLQMACYVLLTAFLYQRGSSESKDPDAHEAVDDDPRSAQGNPNAPWPVRRGGIVLVLYEYSLTIALLLLFLLSFALHLYGGARAFNQEAMAHDGAALSTWQFAKSAQFWFQSFQNWQSEFLAVASLAWLSVYLRQRGSPESKPVATPHRETGA
jgi:hypothetical protein